MISIQITKPARLWPLTTGGWHGSFLVKEQLPGILTSQCPSWKSQQDFVWWRSPTDPVMLRNCGRCTKSPGTPRSFAKGYPSCSPAQCGVQGHIETSAARGKWHWTLYLSFLATTQPCLPTLKLAIIADVRIEGQENEGQLGQITHEEAS